VLLAAALVAVVSRSLRKLTWLLPVKNLRPHRQVFSRTFDETKNSSTSKYSWIIDPANFTVRVFLSDGSETLGLSH